ncbi:MAG TPA: hypothetical protein VL523_06860 [Terriglobia bacterium]|nr:hypothetical protein [Terriglobia bacterium]
MIVPTLAAAILLLNPALPRGAENPPLTAEAIMARVASNQDRSDQLRREYVYHQHIRIVTEKTNGTRMREESADYVVTPTPDGTQKDLTLIAGHYRHKGGYLAFQGEPVPQADSLDGDLIHDFREDLANERSKDGLAHNLFPLTTSEQRNYAFRLLGQETLRGRTVYHVAFRPKDRNDLTWAGEAYIDAADFQPVRVFTKLSRPIPFLIRTFLADLPGIGFDVEYGRQPDGEWFPVSFGTEFRFKLLMFVSRNISISLQNTDFERTHVNHRIQSLGPEQPPL